MNRIYKVVWSRARACYVVVSEYAKRTGKSASTKKLLIALAAAGIMAGGYGTVSADGTDAAILYGENGAIQVPKNGKTLDTGLYIETVKTTRGSNSADTSIRTETGVVSNDSSKIQKVDGYPMSGYGTNNISLGYGTLAGYGVKKNANGDFYHEKINSYTWAKEYAYDPEVQYNFATALGFRTAAANTLATAWGWETVASGRGATAFGYMTRATGNYATSFGDQYTLASGDYSVAGGSGTKQNYTTASGTAALAYGYSAIASGDYSIALGYKSIANGDSSMALGGGMTIVEAEVDPDSGEIVKDPDTGEVKYKYNATYSTAIGWRAKTYAEDAVALGTWSYAKAFRSVAIAGGEANAQYSTAIGWSAQANTEYGMALGAWSIADRDKYSVAYADSQTTPYGYDKRDASDDETVWKSTGAAIAVGGTKYTYDDDGKVTDEETITRQITGVAAGTEATDAVNVAQLQAVEKAIKETATGKDLTVNDGTPAPEGKAYSDGNLQLRNTDTGYDVKLNKDLKKIETITNGTSKITLGETALTLDGLVMEYDGKNMSMHSSTGKAASDYATMKATKTPNQYYRGDGMNNLALGYYTKAGYGMLAITDENGDPVKEKVTKIVRDANENIVFDENGDPMTEEVEVQKYYTNKIDETKQYNNATAFGNNTIAANTLATAWGYDTIASGIGSTAFGEFTTASGKWSLATGGNTTASGAYSFAGGDYSKAQGMRSLAFGYGAETDELAADSISLGGWTKAYGSRSVAIGDQAEAYGRSSFAIGYKAKTRGLQSMALGVSSEANGKRSFALGYDSSATADYATAIAGGTASNEDAIAIGLDSEASGYGAFTIDGTASGEDSFAIGWGSKATAKKAYAIGDKAEATAQLSLALGETAKATALAGTAIGQNAQVKAAHGTALGTASLVDTAAEYSSALGFGSSVFAENSVGVGGVVRSGAKYGTALGYNATVDKNIEGGVALGANSFATTAKGVTGAYADKKGDQDPAYAWKSTAAAVSVGNVGSGITRQITGVAAGKELTDAVNVAQLSAVAATAEDAATKAGKHSIVTKATDEKNITIDSSTTDEQTTYTVGLAKDLSGIETISNGTSAIALGDGYLALNQNGASIVMMDGMVSLNQRVNVLSDGTIRGVKAGVNDTDAVNVGQLKKAISEGVAAGNTDTHIDASKTYKIENDNSIKLDVVDKDGKAAGTVTIEGVAKSDDVGDVSKLKDDLKNYETDEQGNKTYTHTSVVDAVNNLDTKVDGISGRVDTIEKSAGKHSSVSTEDTNISIDSTKKNTAGGTDYKISLAKDLTVDSVDAGGVKIGKDGIDANSQKITNVADGTAAGDAVNYGQLSAVEKKVDNNTIAINNLSGSVNKLGNRINRVGAGAAALAALHPLDFDPEAKWDFAAGYGNYRGANAAAVGAFYRPNENWMLSLGGSFGGGENMVNAGVSLKVGAGSAHAGTSKAAMAKEIRDLKDVVADQSAEIEELKALVNSLIEANKAK